MLEQIEDYFYGRPERITQSGRWMAMTGAYLMVAAAIGQVVTRSVNVFPTLAKQPETTNGLSDIYSMLPLWWVPESWFGVFISVVLIVAGIAMNTHGKRVERMLNDM